MLMVMVIELSTVRVMIAMAPVKLTVMLLW